MVYFELYEGDNEKWRWRLIVGGKIVATDNHGPGHDTKEDCKKDIRKVMRTNKNTPVEDEEGNQIKMFPFA